MASRLGVAPLVSPARPSGCMASALRRSRLLNVATSACWPHIRVLQTLCLTTISVLTKPSTSQQATMPLWLHAQSLVQHARGAGGICTHAPEQGTSTHYVFSKIKYAVYTAGMH